MIAVEDNMNIQELEIKMWDAAKSRDADKWKLIFNMDSRIPARV